MVSWMISRSNGPIVSPWLETQAMRPYLGGDFWGVFELKSMLTARWLFQINLGVENLKPTGLGHAELKDPCEKSLAMVVSSVKHDPRGTSCCRTTYILLNSFPCHLRACRPPGQLPWDSRAFPGPISIELWHIVSVFGTYLWPCFGGFKLLFTWVECQDLMEHMIS